MTTKIKQHPIPEGYEGGYTKPNVTVERRGNGWSVFFVITTILFFGVSIFLYAANVKAKKSAEVLSSKVTDSESRYNDLDTRYSATLADIENYRGKNAALDSMITLNEKTITDLQASLNKDRKTRQLNDVEYKQHLADLDVVITDLNSKIESLQQEKKMLLVAKDSMGNVINVNTIAISDLQNTNSKLNTKVTIASLLIPEEITVTGAETKSNGKESTTMRAEKSEYLKICFNLPANKIADAGRKYFFIRVIDPQGAVISQDSSGVFDAVENNVQMQSSLTSSFQYANAPMQSCSMLKKKTAFVKGNYITELYQDGYLVAYKKFELK